VNVAETDGLMLEVLAAAREADEAAQRAREAASYKFSAVRAALNGGVKATELANALGVSRQRVYLIGRGNRKAHADA
jgi:hypothetical protein